MDRKEYLASVGRGETAFDRHRAYYAQMVSEDVLACVLAHISITRIDASKDPHFNDIAMHLWDVAASACRDCITQSMKLHGDRPTAAGLVCVVKEAARQIKERKHG